MSNSRWTTTSGILASVKRRATLPTSQQLFSDSDLLAMANEELNTKVVPVIMAVGEAHFIQSADTLLSASQTYLDLPAQAMGNKWHAFHLIQGDDAYPLPRISLTEYASIPEVLSVRVQDQRAYIQGTTSDTIRAYYYKRPNYLVGTDEISTVSGSNTTELYVNSAPTNFIGTTQWEIQNPSPPFQTKSSFTGTWNPTHKKITTTTSNLSFGNGDYVTRSGESACPQIPADAHQLLVAAITMRVHEAMGDQASYQLAENTFNEQKSYVENLLSPRVETSPKKITSWRGIWNR